MMKKHDILSSEVEYAMLEKSFINNKDLKPKEIFDILEITNN
jgi:hypothetical protein